MIKGLVKSMLVALPLSFANQLFGSPAGTLDKSFGGDGLVTTAAGTSLSVAEDVILVQGDKKLLAVGRSNDGAGAFDRFALVRYDLSNGALDTTFGSNGIVNTTVGSGNAAAFAGIQQTDSQLVVVGQALNSNAQPTNDFAVVRYNPNGSLDTGFGDEGKVLTPPHSTEAADVFEDGAHAVVETLEHKLVVAGFSGTATDSDFALVRYDSDGSLDLSFSPIGEKGKVTTDFGNSRNDVVFSMLQQADGKLFVAGFSNNGTSDDFAVARYEADGTLDTTFNSNGKQRNSVGSGDDRGLSVIRQTDGKYVVAGYSTTNGDEDIALVRYLPDGHLDSSFSGDGKVITSMGTRNARAYQVMQLPDGKLLVAGYTQVGVNDFDFVQVRYNQDGSLDTTFSGDGKLSTSFGAGSDQAFAAVQQPEDGRIVLAGVAEIRDNLVSQQRFALARYLPGDLDDDGVLDYLDNCPSVKNPPVVTPPSNDLLQPDQDHDMIGDACDDDRDGDGVPNDKDAFPDDKTESNDNDGDGIGDNADPDDDNDCVLDAVDNFPLVANLLNRFDGENKSDFLGYSVAAGDINTDGKDDVIVGAPRFDKKEGKKTLRNAGLVHVYSGELTKQPTILRTFIGEGAGDQFGSAVAGGGDVNGDSIPDILVGAPKADVVGGDGKKRKDAGIAVVFSGAPNGSELFRIEGEAARDNLGMAVAFVKDIDADGRDEVIVGAPKADGVDSNDKKIKDAGSASVYSYKEGERVRVHTFEGESKGDLFGSSVAANDVDKDGKADAIIGAYRAEASNSSGKKLKDVGRVYVYALSGDFPEIFHQNGEQAGSRLGFAVAGADVNGDGFADVLAGAPQEDYIQEATPATAKKTFKDAGIVRVYSGQNQSRLYSAHNEVPQKGALFGSAISDAGVIPGETAHNFIVGAYKYDATSKGKKLANAGRASWHRGSDGVEQFGFDGHNKNNYYGFAVSGSGDHNGDGFTDMIVGGYQDDPLAGNKKITNAGIVELLTAEDPISSCQPPQ